MYIYTDDKFGILKGGGSKKQEQKTRFEAAFFVLVKTIFLYIDDYRYCFNWNCAVKHIHSKITRELAQKIKRQMIKHFCCFVGRSEPVRSA